MKFYPILVYIGALAAFTTSALPAETLYSKYACRYKGLNMVLEWHPPTHVEARHLNIAISNKGTLEGTIVFFFFENNKYIRRISKRIIGKLSKPTRVTKEYEEVRVTAHLISGEYFSGSARYVFPQDITEGQYKDYFFASSLQLSLHGKFKGSLDNIAFSKTHSPALLPD